VGRFSDTIRRNPLFSTAPVRFTITHEFDIPLDALELAFISPNLVDKLAPRLGKYGITAVHQKTHTLTNGVMDRLWHYRANVQLPPFASGRLAELCAWDEHSVYDLKTHSAEWKVVPSIKAEWQQYVSASGRYPRLDRRGAGATRRRRRAFPSGEAGRATGGAHDRERG
jgi:hypothetical protein